MKRSISIAIRIGITLLIAGLIVWGVIRGLQWVKGWLPSFQPAQQSEYFPGIEGDYTYVLYEDSPAEMENPPRMIDGQMYMPVSFVSEWINERFFWDEAEGILTYTTQKDVLRMQTDELTYYVNDSPLTLDLPLVMVEDAAYIPLDLVKRLSAYKFSYNTELDLMIINNAEADAQYAAVVAEKAWLRTAQTQKSNYVRKLQTDERLKILSISQEWYYVRAQDGYLGYVQKEAMGDLYTEYGIKTQIVESDYNEKLDFDGKVNMVWHQVTNMTANSYIADVMADTAGVDVLSPTWFELSDTQGTVSNMADTAYVDYAHANGYQVWALFSNSFDPELTHEVLSSTAKRDSVIKQILAFAAIYELDGINIDFEAVAEVDGPYFVQFIRELTPYLKSQNLVVSVDMYVPKPWTAHYDRAAIGEVIDYLIIMGYDEHYAGSQESGSVASIGFVDEGIADTLLEVPKEKIILGVPFYTRLWEEVPTDAGIEINSKAYGMERAWEIVEENGAAPVWDESLGQYYADFLSEGVTYKVWLEDERSMEARLMKIQEYDLAGISGWKLGLEQSAIWDLIKKYLKT